MGAPPNSEKSEPPAVLFQLISAQFYWSCYFLPQPHPPVLPADLPMGASQGAGVTPEVAVAALPFLHLHKLPPFPAPAAPPQRGQGLTALGALAPEPELFELLMRFLLSFWRVVTP